MFHPFRDFISSVYCQTATRLVQVHFVHWYQVPNWWLSLLMYKLLNIVNIGKCYSDKPAKIMKSNVRFLRTLYIFVEQFDLYCGCLSQCTGKRNVYDLGVTGILTLPFLSCAQSNYSMMFAISHLAELYFRLPVSFTYALIASLTCWFER